MIQMNFRIYYLDKNRISLRGKSLIFFLILTIPVLITESWTYPGLISNPNEVTIINSSPGGLYNQESDLLIKSLPGWFTENRGQVDNNRVIFTYSHSNIAFLSSSVVLELRTDNLNTVRITFPGANEVLPNGEDELNYHSNFFQGNEKREWNKDVKNFKRIIYQNLYVNIDLIYYSTPSGLKYDWVIKPGGNPAIIQERFEGEGVKVSVAKDGALTVKTLDYELREEAPYSHQEGLEVTSRFRIIEDDTISYTLGKYDTSKTLIIDPLLYSTYIGGNSVEHLAPSGVDMAIDSSGNVYVIGNTYSSDFPTTEGAFDSIPNGRSDTFVIKLNENGSKLIYATYVGGRDFDGANGITLDSAGNVYVAGTTFSDDFPTTNKAYDNSYNGDEDVFVFKLNSNGTELIFSSFVGGSRLDQSTDIVIDINKNVIVLAYTGSENFPTTDGAYDNTLNGDLIGDYDVVVFKMTADGSKMVYSTFIGGNNVEMGYGIAIDIYNNVYFTGVTNSVDFPTSQGSFSDSLSGNNDIFVTKLNNNGSILTFSTLVGGSRSEGGMDIIVDNEGNAYVTGYTTSPDFPTTEGVFDVSYNGDEDIIIFKLNNTGDMLIYSTYLGGTSIDRANSLTRDMDNNIYVTGYTNSSDFPTTVGAFDRNKEKSSSTNVFVIRLIKNVTNLDYSTLIGGSGADKGFSIAVDSGGNATVTGYTDSKNYPVTYGAYDISYGGRKDYFVTKLALEPEPPGGLPDLTFAPLTLNTNSMARQIGQIIHLSGTITNTGTEVAPPSEAVLILENPKLEVQQLIKYSLPFIMPGEEYVSNYNFTTNQTGTLTFTLVLDSTNQIIESNEENNEVNTTVRVVKFTSTVPSFNLSVLQIIISVVLISWLSKRVPK